MSFFLAAQGVGKLFSRGFWLTRKKECRDQYSVSKNKRQRIGRNEYLEIVEPPKGLKQRLIEVYIMLSKMFMMKTLKDLSLSPEMLKKISHFLKIYNFLT